MSRPRGCDTGIKGCNARECHYPYCADADYSRDKARVKLRADKAAALKSWKGNTNMTPTGRFKKEFHPPMHNLPRVMGIDISTKPDMVAVAVGGTIMDRATLNAKRASRKADREFIVATLLGLMERHGAEVERRDDGPNPGYHGHSIALRFTLNGVGAMLDIDDLHGGEWSLIHWHNTEYPARNFTSRFCVCVGSSTEYRPHHKATSQPSNWYSLAMYLDAGLCLAARGEAFEPITA